MQNPVVRALLEVIANLQRDNGRVVIHHEHRGKTRVLVPDGARAWRYYTLTTKQLKFWRTLSWPERTYLARMGRKTCLVCTLNEAMNQKKRFEDGLYRALMSFLLEPARRSAPRA